MALMAVIKVDGYLIKTQMVCNLKASPGGRVINKFWIWNIWAYLTKKTLPVSRLNKKLTLLYRDEPQPPAPQASL